MESKRNFKKLDFRQGLCGLLFIAVLCICFLTIMASKRYEEPMLVGRWQSLETGVILEFTQDGKVKFDDHLAIGSYRLLSPSQMEYTIEDKTFLMVYDLQGRQLNWSEDKEYPEKFIRK